MLASLLTSQHGRHGGLLRARSGGMSRGLWQSGDRVRARWRARLSDRLGTFSCELIQPTASRHMEDAQKLACLVAACVLTETALPEREPHPHVFRSLKALLEALETDAELGSAYVKWELGILAALGFGLDLRRCAVTGQEEHLCYVSPRTGRAVTEAAAGDFRDRLFRLPPFLLVRGAAGSRKEVLQALLLTGHFLERHVYGPNQLPRARARLVALLQEE